MVLPGIAPLPILLDGNLDKALQALNANLRQAS